MTLREKIDCMEAFERGEEIERAGRLAGNWHNAPSPAWNWRDYDYRIKPKPKQVVVIEKWLCACSYDGYLIYEGTREYFEDSKIETVKLLDTYEVEL